MAKRDNSKAGAKRKAPREERSVRTAASGERAAAPAERPAHRFSENRSPADRAPVPVVRRPPPDRAPAPSRMAAPKAAGAERQSVRSPNGRSQASSAPPGATISRRAADRLRAGHLWVYASDVVSVTLPNPEKTLLPVADQRGLLLGTALYSPASQIALRLVSREASMSRHGSSCLRRACARPLPAARRCSMPPTMPADCASARPTNCPA